MGTNANDRRANQTVQLLDEIRRLVRFLRVSARGAQKQSGVSGAQLFVLQMLEQADGPLSVNELAEMTRTHQSSVSVVAKKLAREKLVKSVRAKEDARRVELTLTPTSKALLRRSPHTAQEKLIAALDQLNSRHVDDMVKLLGQLNSKLGLDHAAPQLFFEDESSDGTRTKRTARGAAGMNRSRG